jgi:hypothetical protein
MIARGDAGARGEAGLSAWVGAGPSARGGARLSTRLSAWGDAGLSAWVGTGLSAWVGAGLSARGDAGLSARGDAGLSASARGHCGTIGAFGRFNSFNSFSLFDRKNIRFSRGLKLSLRVAYGNCRRFMIFDPPVSPQILNADIVSGCIEHLIILI